MLWEFISCFHFRLVAVKYILRLREEIEALAGEELLVRTRSEDLMMELEVLQQVHGELALNYEEVGNEMRRLREEHDVLLAQHESQMMAVQARNEELVAENAEVRRDRDRLNDENERLARRIAEYEEKERLRRFDRSETSD